MNLLTTRFFHQKPSIFFGVRAAAPESGREAQAAAVAKGVGVFAEDQLATCEEQQPWGFLDGSGARNPLECVCIYIYICICMMLNLIIDI